MEIKKGNKIYFARGSELLDLKIRTIADNWFVGVDLKTKQAFLLSMSTLDVSCFLNRNDALKVARNNEKKEKHFDEKYYEEY